MVRPFAALLVGTTSLLLACGGNEGVVADPTPIPLSSSAASAPGTTTSARTVAVAASASSIVITPNRPDPKTLDCSGYRSDPEGRTRTYVSQRCDAGTQSCCVQGMLDPGKCVTAPAASATELAVEKVFEIECKEPPTGGKSGSSVSRCDESQDCTGTDVCCRNLSSMGDYSSTQCLPRGSAAGGPCPGDERCVDGGSTCRTPGAACVDGFCVKPRNEVVCATASDCLAGQKCYLSPMGTCARFSPVFCEKVADCAEACPKGTRASCAKRTDPRAPGYPSTSFCECS